MAIYRLLDNPGDEDMKPRSSFEGFVPPTKNYFHMPNQWIDICAKIDSLSELKVVQYVLRHTWGYQEYDGVRNITVDEFMDGRKHKDGTRMDSGTGLSEPSVKDGIKRAIRHGYVVCTIDDRDKARVKKYYGLRMAAAFEHQGVSILPPEIGGQASYPLGASILPPGGKNLMARGQETSPRSEKDTIEIHLEKDTIEIQRFGANAPARAHLKADIEETLKQRIDETLEEVEEETAKREAVKIGATTHADTAVHSDLSRGPAHGGAGHDRNSLVPQLATSQHTTTPEPHDDVARTGPPTGSSLASASEPRRSGTGTVPKRPAYRKPTTIEKPQLTLEGQQVKEWYEEKRGTKVRMIEKNIKDCNALGEYEEMTRESLHDTIEHLDKLKWVQEHDYAIDLHVLAGDGRLSFESNWPLVKRKRWGKSSTADEYGNDYSLTALANRPSALD